jgi:hypothetical protein
MSPAPDDQGAVDPSAPAGEPGVGPSAQGHAPLIQGFDYERKPITREAMSALEHESRGFHHLGHPKPVRLLSDHGRRRERVSAMRATEERRERASHPTFEGSAQPRRDRMKDVDGRGLHHRVELINERKCIRHSRILSAVWRGLVAAVVGIKGRASAAHGAMVQGG